MKSVLKNDQHYEIKSEKLYPSSKEFIWIEINIFIKACRHLKALRSMTVQNLKYQFK